MMTDFQNWWDGYFHEINGQKETAQAAWQARGELDAVKIKELEAEIIGWQGKSIEREQHLQIANSAVEELTARNKELFGYIKMMNAQLIRHGVTYKLDGISISEALKELYK